MLKKLFPEKSPIDKARYEIEKTHSKSIQATYKSIEKVNQSLDDLTSKSLKDYEKIERDAITKIDALESSLEKDLAELSKTHQADLALKETSITALKKKLDDQIKALTLDFEKTTVYLEDDLKAIEEEKAITLKEIEKKYLSNTSIYEDKLSLFKKNLEKNQEETKKKFKTLLTTLNQALTILNKEGFKAYQTFDEQVSALYKDYLTALNDETSSIESLKKDFLNETNQLRKSLNVMMKDIDLTLSKTRALIEAPFIAFTRSINAFDQSIKGHTQAFIESINQDFNFESIRLEEALKNQDSDQNEKDKQKDIKARMKLAEVRKETLTYEFTELEKLFDDEQTYLKTSLNHEKSLLDEALDHYEATTKMIHNKLKDLFSVSENYIDSFNRDLSDFTQKDTLNESFKALKTLFEEALKGFKDYEETRLKAHIDYTEKRLDVSVEIDNITMFLDTLEPLKEIEISKQKIKVEQEDASIKHDIDKANLTHQLAIKNLEHEAHVKQERALNELKLKQAHKELETLKLKQVHEHKKHPLLITEAIAKVNYERKLHHLQSDLTLLESKYDLEKEKVNFEIDIKRLTSKKEFDLSLIEIEHEANESTLQQSSEIEQLKQALTFKLDQLKSQTAKEDKQIEKAIKDAEKSHQETLKELNQSLEKALKTHNETLRFIDKALDKEIELPKSHQKEILDMADHKVRLLHEQYRFITDALDPIKEALKSPEVSFKRLLPLVGDAFIHDLSHYINHTFGLLNEAHTFVYNVTSKQVEQMDNERKRQINLDKAKSDHEKILQRIEKSKSALNTTLIDRIKNAKALIKEDKNPSLQSIRAIIKPLTELISEQISKHQNALSEDVLALYKQLTESDGLIIKRAKENHEKAIQQENSAYEKTIAPINQAIKEKTTAFETALIQQKESLEQKKTSALGTINDKIAALRQEIVDKQTQKDLYLKRFKDRELTAKNSYQDALKLIEEEKRGLVLSLDEKTAAKKERINDRIKDAEALFKHEKSMQEIAIETIDNQLDDTLNELNASYETSHSALNETISLIKDDLTNKKKQATDTLNQALKTYEERMISTAPRLEQLIEEATRKLSQEAASKKQKLSYLKDQESTLSKTLNQILSDALLTLKDHLNKSMIIYKDYIATTSFTSDSIDPLIKTNDEFFDSFIKNALNSLTNHDTKG
jgi:ABC-type phosphate transport system auxiliary subunit